MPPMRNQATILLPSILPTRYSRQFYYRLLFGQSSLSNLSSVKDVSVTHVTDLVESEEELKLFAPMGRGFQTGAGTVTNLVGAGSEDIVLEKELGGVGLSAFMAAKIQACKKVIAIYRVVSRLELAKEVGAINVIDTSDASLDMNKKAKKSQIMLGLRLLSIQLAT